jgi:hypothetical protein
LSLYISNWVRPDLQCVNANDVAQPEFEAPRSWRSSRVFRVSRGMSNPFAESTDQSVDNVICEVAKRCHTILCHLPSPWIILKIGRGFSPDNYPLKHNVLAHLNLARKSLEEKISHLFVLFVGHFYLAIHFVCRYVSLLICYQPTCYVNRYVLPMKWRYV